MNKQPDILKWLNERPEQTATFAEIVKEFETLYYCGAPRYISEILRRMIKAGTVQRVRHGIYKSRFKMNANQIDLFANS